MMEEWNDGIQGNKRIVAGIRTVCLCGSTKFKPYFRSLEKILTEKGLIVHSVMIFEHADGEVFTPEQRHLFDRVHFRKIELSDGVFIINHGGYIGLSTCDELFYAVALGKPIGFLQDPGPLCFEYMEWEKLWEL